MTSSSAEGGTPQTSACEVGADVIRSEGLVVSTAQSPWAGESDVSSDDLTHGNPPPTALDSSSKVAATLVFGPDNATEGEDKRGWNPPPTALDSSSKVAATLVFGPDNATEGEDKRAWNHRPPTALDSSSKVAATRVFVPDNATEGEDKRGWFRFPILRTPPYAYSANNLPFSATNLPRVERDIISEHFSRSRFLFDDIEMGTWTPDESVVTRYGTDEEISIVDHEDERPVIRPPQIAPNPEQEQNQSSCLKCPPKIVSWILGGLVVLDIAHTQLRHSAENILDDFAERRKSVIGKSYLAMWAGTVLGIMLSVIYLFFPPPASLRSCGLCMKALWVSFVYLMYYSEVSLLVELFSDDLVAHFFAWGTLTFTVPGAAFLIFCLYSTCALNLRNLRMCLLLGILIDVVLCFSTYIVCHPESMMECLRSTAKYYAPAPLSLRGSALPHSD